MGRNYRSLGRLAARLEALIPKGILQQQVPKRSYPPAVCCDPWRYRTSAVFSVPESWSPRVPGRRELKPEALIWSPWLLPPQLVPADASGLPASFASGSCWRNGHSDKSVQGCARSRWLSLVLAKRETASRGELASAGRSRGPETRFPPLQDALRRSEGRCCRLLQAADTKASVGFVDLHVSSSTTTSQTTLWTHPDGTSQRASCGTGSMLHDWRSFTNTTASST